MTLADWLEVPDDWLAGMRLDLHADGTLVVEQLASNEHSLTRNEVRGIVRDYASANARNGLMSRDDKTLSCGQYGLQTPSVALEDFIDPRTRERRPRVVVEVFCDAEPTFVKIFRMVAGYFRDNADVVSVIAFKFFEPLNPTRIDGLLEVPALAMAFELSNVARTSLIRIVEIKSFGNADMAPETINRVVSCMGLPDFERLNPALEAHLRQPGIPAVIIRADPFPGVDEFRGLVEDPEPLLFHVRMPPPLVPMTFNLLTLFDRAIEGRQSDEVARQATQAAPPQ